MTVLSTESRVLSYGLRIASGAFKTQHSGLVTQHFGGE
jgi:hypothetical protein